MYRDLKLKGSILPSISLVFIGSKFVYKWIYIWNLGMNPYNNNVRIPSADRHPIVPNYGITDTKASATLPYVLISVYKCLKWFRTRKSERLLPPVAGSILEPETLMSSRAPEIDTTASRYQTAVEMYILYRCGYLLVDNSRSD